MKSSSRSPERRRSGPKPLGALRTRSNPPVWSDHLYVELDRADIALFKFILESCDNLAYFSVLDKYRAMIRLSFAPEARETVESLIESLKNVVGIRTWFHIPHPNESSFAS